MILLYCIPTSNTLAVRIGLMRGGTIVATLDPDDGKSLEVNFDQVQLINPGHLPVVRTQTPPANVAVDPGNVAFFELVPGAGLFLRFAAPGQPERSVHFT